MSHPSPSVDPENLYPEDETQPQDEPCSDCEAVPCICDDADSYKDNLENR